MTTLATTRPLSVTGMIRRARQLVADEYGQHVDVQSLNRKLVAHELHPANAHLAGGGGTFLPDGIIRAADGTLATRRNLFGPRLRWIVARDPFTAHMLRDLLPGDEWAGAGRYPTWILAAPIADLLQQARSEGDVTPCELARAWARQHDGR